MRDTASVFALGIAPQIDYATPLAPTSAPKNYELLLKTSRDFAAYSVNPVTNEGETTGTPFPTESRPGRHEVTVSIPERASAQRMGRRAFFAFGDYTVSTLAPGAYKHIFRPLSPQISDVLPVATYVEKAGEPALAANIMHDVMFPSLAAESFSVTGEGDGFLQMASAWRGSGKRITPSGVNFGLNNTDPVHVRTEAELSLANNLFQSTAAVLRLFNNPNFTGTPLAINCDFRSFNFSLNNNLIADDGYLGCGKFQEDANPESGAIRSNMRVGNQTVDISYVLLMTPSVAQQFNPEGKQVVQSYFSSELAYVGKIIGTTAFQHQAVFKFSRQTVQAVQLQSVNGLLAYGITAPPLALGQSVPVELQINTDVPQFGIAA